ncbi:MAG: DUF4254 domain-containing protein [Magnetococcales bacterium]|nr:DUF4254 domain-containing protein [Magnetococcales bacterium]
MTESSFQEIDGRKLRDFFHGCLQQTGWPERAEVRFDQGIWKFIEQNHTFNTILWRQEDLARRLQAPAEEIVANKRAIDRHNQLRNDSIEQMDRLILAQLADIKPVPQAWHNSETAGAIIDRLSILSLKVHHMGLQIERGDVTDEHRLQSREKHTQLLYQQEDLERCLDRLLSACAAGQAFFKIYRQHKMYNDPRFNPLIHASC